MQIFLNFPVGPILSAVLENSNSDADFESKFTSCSKLESETDEEVVLSSPGMQVFFLTRK